MNSKVHLETVQLTKSSRKVWLLLILFILLILPYLFAPLRITLYWLCWHWQQSWNFFFHISDEKVGYDSSHRIWVKAIPYKKPNSFDAFPSEEKRLENTQQMRQSCLILLFNTFHSQIKICPFPPLEITHFELMTLKYPQKLLAKDKLPYQKRQHETNATRRRNNKCHTVPHFHGTVIARVESNRLRWWIINFSNGLELSKRWSVITLVGTLH